MQRTYIVISTALSDLDLKSRHLSLNFNKMPTFSETNQGSSHYGINFRYRPHYCKYKDLYYKPQNHSTVTR